MTMDEGGGSRERGGERGGGGVSAQETAGCVWEGEGGIINLMGLANTDGTPKFLRVRGAVGSSPWFYSYNPCFAFSEGTCQGVAVCQTDETGSMYFNCGDMSSAQLGTDDGKPAVVYHSKATTDIER
ncbi:hypothetical protein V1264_014453 [Littorina saxatilis]|uniref:Uncharacterized protein n=1 Tax=Littorina saxatilis TaxID=31220 RepID=A0AAN9GJC0_9CAEN